MISRLCRGGWIGWVFLIGCLWGNSAAEAQPRPQKVTSLNLCADQLLLALADRQQIASLSRLARDASISFMAEQAAGLPLNDEIGRASCRGKSVDLGGR